MNRRSCCLVALMVTLIPWPAAAQHPDTTTFYQDVAWAPDGAHLLLSRMDVQDDAFPTAIYSIHADGSGLTRLTDGPRDLWTSWSPGGAAFVYAARNEDQQDLYVLPAAGGSSTRLTSDPAEDTHPDWSPDGSRIAFISTRDGTSQVYVMQADGSRPARITDGPEEKWNPRWSPDGSRIAFYGAAVPGMDSLYVVNADGSGRQTLGPGVWPSWSPDGSRLLFAHDGAIYEMTVGEGRRTKRIEDAYFARWSPDGTRIAFLRTTWRASSGWPAASALFVMSADGSTVQRLINSAKQ